MHTNGLRWLVGLGLALLLGCQQAARYGSDHVEPKDKVETKVAPAPAHYGWLETPPRWDLPMVFVSADNKEWPHLKESWNIRPSLPIGLPPLGSVGALGLAFEVGKLGFVLAVDAVKIKVPLGLPDPTPHIPASNPLTLAKWRLGKKLFYDNKLLPKTTRESESCAACHNPEQGFTQWGNSPANVRYNVLSLVNVVYNKQQFWDGRVEALEQVLQRQLSDEDAPIPEFYEQSKSPYRHSWGGVIRRLSGEKEYLQEFKEVFGTFPTIDNVGKALATYLRTLLSGDSLFDQAENLRRQAKPPAPTLLAKHFAPFLGSGDASKAQKLELGYRVFVKSGCAKCHAGPLFTDQDYHNISVGDSFREVRALVESVDLGRMSVLPLGLKDRRYIGAYRTPTLRNLSRFQKDWTVPQPYMHQINGTLDSLDKVIKHYQTGLGFVPAKDVAFPDSLNLYLDPLLREPLVLSDAEREALELFLRALDGKEIAEPWIPKRSKEKS